MICCILSLIIFAALAYGFSKLDANPLLAFYERFFPNKDKLRNKIVWVVGASTGTSDDQSSGEVRNNQWPISLGLTL